MYLDELKPGRSAIIRKVGGEGALRLRLLDMGIIPRTRVKLIKTAPMGDPIEIEIRGYELTIRKEDAHKIEIAEEEEVLQAMKKARDEFFASGESEDNKQ